MERVAEVEVGEVMAIVLVALELWVVVVIWNWFFSHEISKVRKWQPLEKYSQQMATSPFLVALWMLLSTV
jgi:hypothetical protein